MSTVWIPALMRDLTGGQDTVSASGATVAEVIAALEQLYPGMQQRLCTADGLRAGMTVVVDTEVARLGLLQPVREKSEIHFLPAIAGG